MGFDVPINTL